MNLLYCIHSADPLGGGPVEFIRQAAVQHAKHGEHVEVACLDAPDRGWIKDFPAPIHALGPGSIGYGLSWRYVTWLSSHRSDYDLVIANGMWQFSGLGSWLALLFGETPYVIFPHGMLDPWFNKQYPLKALKKQMYWWLAEHRVLKHSCAVLFTSDEERRCASRSFWPYQCTEVVVGLGIQAPSGDADFQKEQFFKAFPQLRGKRFILYMSRIHPKKGCDLLLSSFSKLPPEAADLHLVMAGASRDDYENLLRREFESDSNGLGQHVTWTGNLSGDLKLGAIRAAEVLILPSHQENFGFAVVEALAVGTPVLISNKINIWPRIFEDGAGLVENDDEEGVSQMLRRWVSLDYAERCRFRERASQCFARAFDLGANFDAYRCVLQECVEGYKGSGAKHFPG